jgi:hypothetical protein
MTPRIFFALLIPTLTLVVALDMLAIPAKSTPTAIVHAPVDSLDIDLELHTGCEVLIALATQDPVYAPWAIAELQRAASAPWASAALRGQAEQGLARVRPLLASH